MPSFFKLSNWPILAKILLMLAIAFGGMLLVAVTTINSLNSSVKGIDNIIKQGLQPALELGGVGEDVKTAESELYQILTSSAAGKDVDVESSIEAIREHIGTVISRLQTLKNTAQIAKQQNSLQTAIDDLTQYQDAISVVGSMVELDFASAVGMLDPFSNLSENVNDTIRELISQSRVNADTIARKAATNAELAEDIAVGVAGISIVLLLIISSVMVHGMTTRLKKLATALCEVVDRGEFTMKFDIYGNDEVGRAGQAFKALLENVGTTIEKVTTVVENMAEGHFSIGDRNKHYRGSEADTLRLKGQLGRLNKAVNASEAHLASTIHRARDSANHLGSSVVELATNQEELDRQSEFQQQSVIRTVDDMNEIADMIKATDESTTVVNNVIHTTVEETKSIEEMAFKAIEAMKSIHEANNNVVNISGKIDEIAAHTNLLALNASIESARAGEHGRGFSVVADEIRMLAQSAAESTQDIKHLLDDTSLQISEGSNLVKEVSASLNAVVSRIEEVSAKIHQIADTSSKQKMRVDTVNESMDELKNINLQNRNLTEKVSRTFRSMEEKSTQMVKLMEFFKINGGNN